MPMMDLAQKDFEQFCANNEEKPTNQKADYYLAGHYKGQRSMLEKACSWLLRNRKNYDYINIDGDVFDISLIKDFKQAMER